MRLRGKKKGNRRRALMRTTALLLLGKGAVRLTLRGKGEKKKGAPFRRRRTSRLRIPLRLLEERGGGRKKEKRKNDPPMNSRRRKNRGRKAR